jgi:hypothetical protein
MAKSKNLVPFTKTFQISDFGKSSVNSRKKEEAIAGVGWQTVEGKFLDSSRMR